MSALRKFVETNREIIMYLLVGGITVLLNIVLFMGFSGIGVSIFWSNNAAFIACIIFAYFTNAIFVFQDRLRVKSFVSFFIMRFMTIFIDTSGVIILIYLTNNKLYSKILINILIIVINYLLSKFVIFKKESSSYCE